MSLQSVFFRSLKWSTINTFGISLFQILQVAILTRFLDKEDFGLMALALLVVNLTNIFVEMGMAAAIFHKENINVKEYSSLYWLNIAISMLFYIILFFLAETIANFYEEQQLENIVKVLGLNILFIAIGKQHRTILQKHLHFDILARVDLWVFLFGLIIAVFLAMHGWGIYSLIYSTLFVSCMASLIILIKEFKANPIHLHFSFSETKPFLKVGGYSLGSNLMDYLSRELDVVILGKVVGLEFLGVYSLAKQITLKVYSLITPIVFNVFNPLLAKMASMKEKMESLFLQMTFVIGHVSSLIFLILILIPEEILFLLYGKDYVEGYKILIWLSLFQTAFTMVKPTGSLQIATGKTEVGFVWTIFRNSITTLLLIFWANKMGPQRIPELIGFLGVFFVLMLWPIQIKKLSSIPFKTYINRIYVPLLGLLFVIFLKLYILDSLGSFSILSSIINLSLGVMSYLIIIGLLDGRTLLKTFKSLNFKNGR